MKNYITLMTQELYRWFDIFNEELFGNQLPPCAITIQKTKNNVLGYATVDKVWKPITEDGEEPDESMCQYEICISANNLKLSEEKTIYDLCGVLVHEQVHVKALHMGVKDCNGQNHNKKFKKNAEEAKLIVNEEKDKKVGYGFTKPSEVLKQLIDEKVKPDASIFTWYRVIPVKDKEEKPPQKKFKTTLWCPQCEFEIKIEEALEEYEGFGCDITCPSCGGDFEIKPKGKRGRKPKED